MTAAVGCAPSERPKAGGEVAVWIDADPMIGEAERDVSGAFALVQAFNSDVLDVRGVSAVFGEVPLVRTWPITQDLVDRFGPATLRPWRGAAGPHERHAPTEASEALATALRKDPLVIVALGPLTNIASTLTRNPELAARVVRVVALTGTRDAETSATAGNGAAPPPHAPGPQPWRRRDVNVALDVAAAEMVLDSGVPLTLVPLEIAGSVWITGEDLDRLADGPAAARFLAEGARTWLRVWEESGGAPGFHPYETLAVDVAGTPDGYACVDGAATIEERPDPAGGDESADGDQQARMVVREGASGRMVTYCHTADASFKARLLTTLGAAAGSGLAGG